MTKKEEKAFTLITEDCRVMLTCIRPQTQGDKTIENIITW